MATRLSQSTPHLLPLSPSLVALLELVPPSPILSPSDLSASLTSGEIPILLFNNQQDQYMSPLSPGPRTWGFNLSRSSLQIGDHDFDGLSSEASTGTSSECLVDTRAAFDTFGRWVQKGARHRLSLCWSSNLATGDFIREGQDDNSSDISDIACHEDSWIGASEWDHLPQPLAKVPLENRGEQSVSLQLEPEQNHKACPTTCGTSPTRDLLLVNAQLEDNSLVMRSSSSILNSGLQNQDYTASATQEDAGSCFGSGEISLIDFCMGETSNIQSVATTCSNSSLSRRPAIHAACPSPTLRKVSQVPVLEDSPESLSRSQTQTIPSVEQGGSRAGSHGINLMTYDSPATHSPMAVHEPPLQSLSPRPMRFPLRQLPQSLSAKTTTTPRGYEHEHYPWLQSTTLTLVIDQEGFRTIEPVFKQVGTTRRHLPESGNTELEVVMFVPTMRRAFRFHYAPFDGSPILRRLIVNGDEGRDFLSRQAYLNLKSTGVYTVHGTEVASSIATALRSSNSIDTNFELAHSGALESTKLYWQFDYSVEDRKVEQTGRVLDGERILIPLTFVCSPRLLHPCQGKRIKLMQIVKKTVTPKLVAERRQSPSLHPAAMALASSSASGVPPLRKTSVVHNATQLYFAKSQAWNLHRRSHSNPREHGVTETPSTLPEASSPPDYRDSTNPSISDGDDSHSVRRRRASSAGEGRTGARTPVSPVRHILPPSRLRQLLEGGQVEQESLSERPFVQSTLEIIPDFLPLKPSPRFRN